MLNDAQILDVLKGYDRYGFGQPLWSLLVNRRVPELYARRAAEAYERAPYEGLLPESDQWQAQVDAIRLVLLASSDATVNLLLTRIEQLEKKVRELGKKEPLDLSVSVSEVLRGM